MNSPDMNGRTPDGRALGNLDPVAKRKRGRGIFRGAVAVILIVGALVTLRVTVLAPKAVSVTTVEVQLGKVESTVTNTRAGTVKARLRARLSPQIGGRVVSLPFREGDRVERGQLLVRLDDSVQRAQVDLATESVRAAAARADEACLAADLARKELGRQIDLHGRGISSEGILDRMQSERDRSEATCRAVRAGEDQALANLRLVQTQLDLTEMRAPFSGIVAELTTEVGEWITPSPPGLPIPPIVDLMDPNSLYISAPIDEMDSDLVSAGQDVRLSVDSRRGESFPGRLVRVSPYVLDLVEQNRTLEVEAEFLDPGTARSLLPGTSADVEVILDSRENVLQIPSTAVADGVRVLVVVDGVLEEREVVAGLTNWRTTEILQGLAEGDRVVVSRNSADIKAGVRVEIEAAQ